MNYLAISIQGLCRSVGGVQLLHDIELNIMEGEFIALIGANGAGKTTLLKCLLDICTVTSGKIEIFGIDHLQKEARQSLAFLPEIFTPPYYLTGKEFLVYMAELHGMKYDHEKITELANILDLDIATLSKSVRAFSKGMAQKLGLLACLASDKALMIFDEPLTGLDPKSRDCFKQYLMQLKQLSKTIFFSTHLLEDLNVLCDRIVILDQGRIRFNGTPDECKQMFAAESLQQAYLNCIET